ncbi:helix-turn-helix domain-containing protein [Bacillus infantis]|uniref:helix-turn-helix domain-containing protein n=1 Tax=Bacillus infantis TaxID=324767 RepID=UPI003CEA470D
MNEFGQYLRELRGNRSLREVANEAGISHTYIRNLELGKMKEPSNEVITKLAKVYKVPYYHLMATKVKLTDYPYSDPEAEELVEEMFDLHKSFERYQLSGTYLDLKNILEGDYSVFYDEKKLTSEQKQMLLGILKVVVKEG